MEIAIIIAAVWVVCGVLAYGMAVYSLQQIGKDLPGFAESSLPGDRRAGRAIFLAGPVGVLTIAIHSISRGESLGLKW